MTWGEKKRKETAFCLPPSENGHAVHSREVQHLGATTDPTQDRSEREHLRPPVLGDGAVLSEPRVLGVRAPDAPLGHGPERRSQHAGCVGAEGEEREERDQSAEHAALHQGEETVV